MTNRFKGYPVTVLLLLSLIHRLDLGSIRTTCWATTDFPGRGGPNAEGQTGTAAKTSLMSSPRDGGSHDLAVVHGKRAGHYERARRRRMGLD